MKLTPISLTRYKEASGLQWNEILDEVLSTGKYYPDEGCAKVLPLRTLINWSRTNVRLYVDGDLKIHSIEFPRRKLWESKEFIAHQERLGIEQ